MSNKFLAFIVKWTSIELPQIPKALKQDAVPLSVGTGFLGFSNFADATVFIQQLGVWFGTALVIVTLAHRLWLWWKDATKGD